MAKIKITLVKQPSFPAIVEIPVPGSSEPDRIEFSFKFRDRDEFKQWADSLAGRENVELIMDTVVGWKFAEAPFNEENVAALDKMYLGFATAIINTYINEVGRQRVGN